MKRVFKNNYTTGACHRTKRKGGVAKQRDTPQTLAAADRRFVELGARIMLGRGGAPEPAPVRYTIPAPILGFRFAGVTVRMGTVAPEGSLNADGRVSLGAGAVNGRPALVPEAVRPLSACDEGRVVLVDTLRADGIRMLLCDVFGCRPDAWGRRSGRGIDACLGVEDE